MKKLIKTIIGSLIFIHGAETWGNHNNRNNYNYHNNHNNQMQQQNTGRINTHYGDPNSLRSIQGGYQFPGNSKENINSTSNMQGRVQSNQGINQQSINIINQQQNTGRINTHHGDPNSLHNILPQLPINQSINNIPSQTLQITLCPYQEKIEREIERIMRGNNNSKTLARLFYTVGKERYSFTKKVSHVINFKGIEEASINIQESIINIANIIPGISITIKFDKNIFNVITVNNEASRLTLNNESNLNKLYEIFKNPSSTTQSVKIIEIRKGEFKLKDLFNNVILPHSNLALIQQRVNLQQGGNQIETKSINYNCLEIMRQELEKQCNETCEKVFKGVAIAVVIVMTILLFYWFYLISEVYNKASD